MLDSYMSYSADDKLKIIEYSYKHGIDKTLEALALDSNRSLSKATLCRWRKKWKESQEAGYGNGNLYDLRDKSRKPINYRQSETNGLILQFIQRTRLQYTCIGKDKLKVLVDEFVNDHNQKLGRVELKTISASTIGRILASFKKQRIIPNWSTGESKKVGLHGGTGNLILRTIKKKEA